MTLETDQKIQILRETLAELEKRIQLISVHNEDDFINKGHLETLAKNVRLTVIDLIDHIP